MSLLLIFGQTNAGEVSWVQLSAPSTNVTFTPAAGSLTLTGQTPTRVNTGEYGLQVTWAEVQYQTTGPSASPAVGTLALTGQAPSLKSDLVTSPDVGTLALTGATPLSLATILATPDAGTLALTGQAPSLRYDLVTSPAAGALILAGAQPALSTGAGYALQVTWAEVQYQASSNTALPIAAGTLALTGQAPALQFALVASPDVGALSLTGATPLSLATLLSAPGAGSLALAGQLPTVSTSSNGVAQPASGSVTLAGQAPELRVPVTATPTDGALALAGQQPTLNIAESYAVQVTWAEIKYQTPVVAYTASPGAGALSLGGKQPNLNGRIVIFTPADTRYLTGNQPSTAIAGAAPTVRVTWAEIQYQTIYTNYAPVVPVGTLSLSGQAPLPLVEDPNTPQRTIRTLLEAPPAFSAVDVPAAYDVNWFSQTPIYNDYLTSLRVAQPGAGLFTLTGTTPTFRFGVGGTVGGLTLTGSAPSALIKHGEVSWVQMAVPAQPSNVTFITVPSGAANLSGRTPVAQATSTNVVISPATGALTVSSTTPMLAESGLTKISVDAGSLTINEQDTYTLKTDTHFIPTPLLSMQLTGAGVTLDTPYERGVAAANAFIQGLTPTLRVYDPLYGGSHPSVTRLRHRVAFEDRVIKVNEDVSPYSTGRLRIRHRVRSERRIIKV